MEITKLLKQYKDLCREIKELENYIKKLENRNVSDIVAGSNNEFPYQIVNFKIEGLAHTDKLREVLIERKVKCEQLKIKIEEFISNIPDSRTRRIFQYRYIDGLTWLQIAMRMNKVHESYPRKIHDRYLENIK
ncbi:MAG: hypothetical protein WBI45_08085 [Defluviitoga tunisiensis]